MVDGNRTGASIFCAAVLSPVLCSKRCIRGSMGDEKQNRARSHLELEAQDGRQFSEAQPFARLLERGTRLATKTKPTAKIARTWEAFPHLAQAYSDRKSVV